MKCPAVFKNNGNSYVVTFRDVSQEIIQGSSYKEAYTSNHSHQCQMAKHIHIFSGISK